MGIDGPDSVKAVLTAWFGMSGTSKQVEKVDDFKWKRGDTVYVLTDMPDTPCHECGGEIGGNKYCYFRDSPDDFDHICWDCGRKITGFGEPGPNA